MNVSKNIMNNRNDNADKGDLSRLVEELYASTGKPFSEILQTLVKVNKDINPQQLRELIVGNSKYHLGQFITPLPLARLIAQLVPIEANSTVVDPTCGIGTLLQEANKLHLKANYFGIDINPSTTEIAKLVLDKSVKIFTADSLNAYPEEIPLADVVISNFPFGLRLSSGKVAEVEFINKYLQISKADATICVVVPEGVLNRSNSGAQDFRKEITTTHHLSAVISLPSSAFAPYSGIKTSVLIIKKGKSEESTFYGQIEDLDDTEEVASLINTYKYKKSHVDEKFFWIEKNEISDVWNYSYYDPKNKVVEAKAKELGYEIKQLEEIAEIISPKSDYRKDGSWNYPVFKGDILFATDGTIGRPVLISIDKKIYISKTKFTTIRLKSLSINPTFLIAYLNSKYTTSQIEQHQFGIIPHFSLKALASLKIIVPPAHSQKEVTDTIANEYSDIQSNLEKIASIAQSVKNRVAQELFNIEDISKSFKPIFETTHNKILSSYPFPISYIYRDLKMGRTNTLERFNRLIDLYEIILKSTAIIYFSATKDLGIEVDALIKDTRMQKPFLGNWLSLLLKSREEVYKVKKIYPYDNFDTEDIELFTDLNDLRNDTRGHGSTPTEDIANRHLNEYLPRVERLISKLIYCSTGYILYTKELQEDDDGFSVTGLLLQGDNSIFTEKVLKRKDSLKTKRLYYIDSASGLSLHLYPWIILEQCPECHEKEILFYDMYRGKPVYLGYKHSWKPELPEYIDAFKKELFINP